MQIKAMTEKQIVCSKINMVQNLLKDIDKAELKSIIKLLQDIKVEIRQTL
jgi:hypothetical protein